MASRLLIAACLLSAAASAAPLEYAEYVITQGSPDNDPGLGNGTPIPLTGLPEAVSLSFVVPPAALTGLQPGTTHHLAVRVRDVDGAWTVNPARTFQIPAAPAPVSGPGGALVAEFIFAESAPDNDPGPGMGIPANAPAFGANARLFTAADLAHLTPGVHRLAVRAKVADSTWSQVLTRTFVVPDAAEAEPYFARWYVRDATDQVIGSGDLGEGPLTVFPSLIQRVLPLTNALPGAYTCQIALEDFQGFPAEIASHSFDIASHQTYWELNHFTNPADRADPSISGANADPNGDGWSNLESFILGLDPTASPSYTPLTVDADGPVAVLRTPASLPPGSRIRLEGSPDLVAPFDELLEIESAYQVTPALGVVSVQRIDGDGRGEITVDPPVSPSWEHRGFFRLVFERDGPWIFDE